MQEHLLLGSYIFPLLVKCKLSRAGLYTLTDRDQDDIDVFERLACVELFPQVSDDPTNAEDESREFSWNEVRSGFLFDRMSARISIRQRGE